jgi:hypothetical protein
MIGFVIVTAFWLPSALQKHITAFASNPTGNFQVQNLCQNHGGLAQALGIGNGRFQQLGYECRDGFGGKVSVK